MNANFSLKNHAIYIWYAWLPDFAAAEEDFFHLLSADEVERAQRFRFPLHRQRYVITRGILRSLLAQYTQQSEIVFSYGEKGKPYLANSTLQFNVSHSDSMAVFAFTQDHPIGIDIEKMEKKSHIKIAERFFSPEENQQLKRVSADEQNTMFYRIWSTKEAIIKTIGLGLWMPLDEFSVPLSDSIQTIKISHQDQVLELYVENLEIHPDYQATVATTQKVLEKYTYRYFSV